jgi:hypothetical protein
MSSRDARSGTYTNNSPVLGSIIIIIVVMLVTTTATTYSAQLATENTTSSSSSTAAAGVLAWNPAPTYPTSIWLESCVSSGGYIYCIGGEAGASSQVVDVVYYAQITPTGLGPWASTTSYPESVRSQSCVAEASMVYCVGGYNSTQSLNDVYYAPLSSSGVGQWTMTTSFPLNVGTLSCATSNQGVYCVGGSLRGGQPTDAVYFAPFSVSGLGAWTSTTSYPIVDRQLSCVSSASDLYCIGGVDVTAVYYAPLTSSGIGQWASTTAYPFTIGANLLSCVTIGTTIYCVAGHTGPNVSDAVHHASLSISGVGAWANDTNYPVALWGGSCVTWGSSIYCVGGQSQSGALIDDVSFSSSS